jgi:hypothetical protein
MYAIGGQEFPAAVWEAGNTGAASGADKIRGKTFPSKSKQILNTRNRSPIFRKSTLKKHPIFHTDIQNRVGTMVAGLLSRMFVLKRGNHFDFERFCCLGAGGRGPAVFYLALVLGFVAFGAFCDCCRHSH